MKIGNRIFDMNGSHVYVMGILNVTPDSFSDGGKFHGVDDALKHAEEMINQGVDIIDIGGESTRPGYIKISEEEEIDRVCTAVNAIKERFEVPISVDTYKYKVMDACLAAGADMANDIWGFQYDDEMAKVVARFGVPVVLMHNDNLGRSLDERTPDRIKDCGLSEEEVRSVVLRVRNGLQKSIDIALGAGVKAENIILDPGVGFAKTQEENLQTTKYLKEFVKLGYPVLLGTSRKSMIGNALDLPVEEREEGTLVTTILGAEAGCKFVRVHDVEKNVRAIKMYEAIINS